MAAVSLILGGARSGKSRYAEKLATDSHKEVIYVATATAFDEEMQARITHHRQQRNPEWFSVEEPLHLPEIIHEYSSASRCLLVDCLTLWMNNILFMTPDMSPSHYVDRLVQTCRTTPGELIFVANEVGLGVIPMGKISRQFVDESGRLNQRMAEIADHVTFIAAGLPMTLKSK
jgi:Adenosyl cobinamide kinase/adenosyl cobinamide phosphate guanylyltransferase